MITHGGPNAYAKRESWNMPVGNAAHQGTNSRI